MEKYGTLPPKFTKDWWIHYWTYYKIPFLIGCFILFGIVQLILAIASNVNYDLKIQHLTSAYELSEDSFTLLNKKTKELSRDVTENKKIETTTVSYALPPFDDIQRFQELQATQTRLIGDLQMYENQIYIVDKIVADVLYSYECMLPVKDWAENATDDKIYTEIAFSLSGNKAIENLGLNTEDLYICVLKPFGDYEKKKECIEKFENAKYVAKELIKE